MGDYESWPGTIPSMATLSFELYTCPDDPEPHTGEQHGFSDDTGICVCGKEWVSRTVEFDEDHPFVKALSSPTVRGPRRQRRQV